MTTHCKALLARVLACGLLLPVLSGCGQKSGPTAPAPKQVAAAMEKQATPDVAEKGTVKVDLRRNAVGLLLSIDGDEYTPKEMAEPLQLKAGDHKLVVKQGGKEIQSVAFMIEPGKRKVVEVLDPDLEAAQWVLSMRSSLTISSGGKNTVVKDVAALPTTPFSVVAVELRLKHITDEMLINLKGLQHLGFVNLSGASVTDAGLAHLAAIPALTEVRASWTAVTGTGFEAFPPESRLEGIHLIWAQVNDRGLETIARLQNVRSLYIGESHVTDDGLVALKGMRKLIAVNLSNAKLTNRGIANLNDIATLENLVLSGVAISEVKLEKLKRLRILRVDGTAIDNGALSDIAKLKSLEELNLERAKIADAGLEALSGHPKLRRLGLRGTKVTAAGVAKLQASLPQCKIDVNPEVQAELAKMKK